MSAMRAATLLLVDDSPEDRHTYMSYLQADSECLYTFLEADNAEEGLRIGRQAQLDCIILDYELPDMSGLEFLGRLKQEKSSASSPVIMVTGRGSEAVAVAALKAGACDYLVKSDVSRQSVFRATHNAFKEGQLNRALAQETREREGAEADLRDSESNYRMLVDSVLDYAIMLLDADGNITSWNSGARRLFGFHDDEVLMQHVRRLFPTQALRSQSPDQEMSEARQGGTTTSEGHLMRKDGTTFWGIGSISPVHDRYGQLCGYSKVVREVDNDPSLRHAAIDDPVTNRLREEALAPLRDLRARVEHKAGGGIDDPAQWGIMLNDVIAKVERLCR